MKRAVFSLALLGSCSPCDNLKALPIDDGTYVEREGDKRLVDAVIVIDGDAVTVEYTGDDGERYLAVYDIVERGGG